MEQGQQIVDKEPYQEPELLKHDSLFEATGGAIGGSGIVGQTGGN